MQLYWDSGGCKWAGDIFYPRRLHGCNQKNIKFFQKGCKSDKSCEKNRRSVDFTGRKNLFCRGNKAALAGNFSGEC